MYFKVPKILGLNCSYYKKEVVIMWTDRSIKTTVLISKSEMGLNPVS